MSSVPTIIHFSLYTAAYNECSWILTFINRVLNEFWRPYVVRLEFVKWFTWTERCLMMFRTLYLGEIKLWHIERRRNGSLNGLRYSQTYILIFLYSKLLFQQYWSIISIGNSESTSETRNNIKQLQPEYRVRLTAKKYAHLELKKKSSATICMNLTKVFPWSQQAFHPLFPWQSNNVHKRHKQES